MTWALGRRPAVAVTVALVCVLLLVGCGSRADGGDTGSAPVTGTTAGPLAADGLQDPRPQGPSGAVARAGSPVRISIPSIGVDATLESLDIDGTGRLVPPQDWDAAGWYAGGVAPGAVGAAIIAGHVDSPTAPAVFARLGELPPGATVTVTMSDGTAVGFSVTGSIQSPKSDFPTAEVYRNVPIPALRLITCTGTFDSSIGHYTDNLIVYAELDSGAGESR